MDTHPLFVNRGSALVALMDRASPFTATAASIIEIQVVGVLARATLRDEHDGDISARVLERVPLDLAYRTIDFIIQGVLANGQLDATSADAPSDSS